MKSLFLVVVDTAIFLLWVPSDLAAAWSAINLKHTSMLWLALPQYARFADLSDFSALSAGAPFVRALRSWFFMSFLSPCSDFNALKAACCATFWEPLELGTCHLFALDTAQFSRIIQKFKQTNRYKFIVRKRVTGSEASRAPLVI